MCDQVRSKRVCASSEHHLQLDSRQEGKSEAHFLGLICICIVAFQFLRQLQASMSWCASVSRYLCRSHNLIVSHTASFCDTDKSLHAQVHVHCHHSPVRGLRRNQQRIRYGDASRMRRARPAADSSAMATDRFIDARDDTVLGSFDACTEAREQHG